MQTPGTSSQLCSSVWAQTLINEVYDGLVLFSMGMSEVVMLDTMGHIVVLGTALGTLMVPGYWSLQMG